MLNEELDHSYEYIHDREATIEGSITVCVSSVKSSSLIERKGLIVQLLNRTCKRFYVFTELDLHAVVFFMHDVQ